MTPARKQKILIVDDDKTTVNLITHVLSAEASDCEFYQAFSGNQALEEVKKDRFDLIILDILMPDVGGCQVCESLKTMPDYRDVPVIFITSLGATDEKIQGFKAGAADYIVKPIDVQEMKARVRTHLKFKHYQDRLKEANEIILRTQAVLIDNAKMSALSNLVRGISHEFNNILFMMRGYVDIVKRNRATVESHGDLTIIEELIERAAKVVRKLHEFSRKDAQETKETANIRELIEEDIRYFYRHLNSAGIAYEITGESIPPMKCYPSQLSQLFFNIVSNAIDAMKDSPERKMTITMRLCDRKEGYSCHPDIAGDWVCGEKKKCAVISFGDTGCGIPEDIRDKIFDPFITTKGVIGGGSVTTPGTGLGLSIAYSIAKRHDGNIFFTTEVGKGTRFDVLLPVEE